MILARNWWAVATRGALAILFGLLTLTRPRSGLLAIVLVFGAYAIADGVLNLVSAARAGKRQESWGVLAVAGLAGIASGIVAFAWPGITALALLYLVGAWAIVVGAFEIGAAVRLRRVIKHEWALGLLGALGVVFGVMLFAQPLIGLYALVIGVGLYALASGVTMLVLGFRLRRLYIREVGIMVHQSA
jgi:uncharacterized membrane protein HdeD (DUF308 family)